MLKDKNEKNNLNIAMEKNKSQSGLTRDHENHEILESCSIKNLNSQPI